MDKNKCQRRQKSYKIVAGRARDCLYYDELAFQLHFYTTHLDTRIIKIPIPDFQ